MTKVNYNPNNVYDIQLNHEEFEKKIESLKDENGKIDESKLTNAEFTYLHATNRLNKCGGGLTQNIHEVCLVTDGELDEENATDEEMLEILKIRLDSDWLELKDTMSKARVSEEEWDNIDKTMPFWAGYNCYQILHLNVYADSFYKTLLMYQKLYDKLNKKK